MQTPDRGSSFVGGSGPVSL